jgi:hypothetical protein
VRLVDYLRWKKQEWEIKRGNWEPYHLAAHSQGQPFGSVWSMHIGKVERWRKSDRIKRVMELRRRRGTLKWYRGWEFLWIQSRNFRIRFPRKKLIENVSCVKKTLPIRGWGDPRSLKEKGECSYNFYIPPPLSIIVNSYHCLQNLAILGRSGCEGISIAHIYVSPREKRSKYACLVFLWRVTGSEDDIHFL